jgi:hypothetical protein
MNLLQSGVAAPVIALWLGQEDPATTHQYIEADLLMKEQALRRLQASKERHARFKPRADLLPFSIVSNYAKAGRVAPSAISNAHRRKSRLVRVKLCLIPDCS